MKRLLSLVLVAALALALVFGAGASVKAADQNGMVEMISEEMTANYLYTELAKKYPQYDVFSRLAESEVRHTESLQRAAARLGLSVEAAKPANIVIPESLDDALAFAVAYELEDIEMLEKLIASETDTQLQRVLNNLLNGSRNHYNIMKRAVDEGIDNLNCTGNFSGQNRVDGVGGLGDQGQSRGLGNNQSQGQGINQGQGQGMNQSQGQGINQGQGQGMNQGQGQGQGINQGQGQGINQGQGQGNNQGQRQSNNQGRGQTMPCWNN